MEEALIARLLAFAGLSALVDDRVWPIERPEGTSLPALTLQVVSPQRTYTHDGASGFYGPRVQFDSWGETYAAAKLVARQVTAALEVTDVEIAGVRFDAAFLDAERDMGLDDIPGGDKAFRVSQDFFVWWQPLV